MIQDGCGGHFGFDLEFIIFTSFIPVLSYFYHLMIHYISLLHLKTLVGQVLTKMTLAAILNCSRFSTLVNVSMFYLSQTIILWLETNKR